MKAILTFSFLLCISSCYSSSRPGPVEDTREDIEMDHLEWAEPDLPPPPYSIDFVITNGSPASCSSCVVYLDYTFWNFYSLGVTYGGQGISWHPPDCTVDCSSVSDPMLCCIDCGAPLPSVKQLYPGESVTVSWNGYRYWMDFETCDCGCTMGSPVDAGSGNAAICAYSSYACPYGNECTVGDDGVITMAEVSGDPLCAEASFSFPQDSGGEAALVVVRGDNPPGCEPQEAYEDPTVDCERCISCDATPYVWTGDGCAFSPICCACAGRDCDSRFINLQWCLDAYRTCPMVPEVLNYPGARLAWQAPGGFTGMGPMLLIDGSGLARFWEANRGLYDLADPGEWDRADWDYMEELGADAANELFSSLASVDFSNLPHPPTIVGECYPSLKLRLCETCEILSLDYSAARDLLPELASTYRWIDERLCRGIDTAMLPGAYCEAF
jgi:hypothetical protein